MLTGFETVDKRDRSHFSEKYAFARFENGNFLAWDERGIAIPLMDQNERTAGTGIFLAISKSSFFCVSEKVNSLLCHALGMCDVLLVIEMRLADVY